MIAVLINALLYVGLTVRGYRKNGGPTIYTLLCIWYAFIATAGFVSYADGVYIDAFGEQKDHAMALFWYLLAFPIYLFLFKPIKNISRNGVDTTPIPNSGALVYFVYANYIVVYLLVALLLPHLRTALSTGLELIYAESSNGESAIPSYLNPFLTLYRGIQYLLVLYSGYLLTVRKHVLGGLFGLVGIIALDLILAFMTGSRGGVFFKLIDYLFVFLLFKDCINKKLKRTIKIVSLASLVIISTQIWAITVGRFGQEGNEFAVQQIERYFGEAFPNYGYRVMGKAKGHLYGERFAPEIYQKVTGVKPFRDDSPMNRQKYYEGKTNLPIINFKTLVGDFYAEFGFFIGLPLLLIIGIVFRRLLYVRRRKLPFYKSLILMYYYQFCITGALDNTKFLTAIPILLMNVFWIFFIYYLEKNNTRNFKKSYNGITSNPLSSETGVGQ